MTLTNTVQFDKPDGITLLPAMNNDETNFFPSARLHSNVQWTIVLRCFLPNWKLHIPLLLSNCKKQHTWP